MKKRHYIQLVVLLIITFFYVSLKKGPLLIEHTKEGRLTVRVKEKESHDLDAYSLEESERIWIRSDEIRYIVIENGKMIFTTNLPNQVEFDPFFLKLDK